MWLKVSSQVYKFKVGRETVTKLWAHSRKHTNPARQLEVEWLCFQFSPFSKVIPECISKEWLLQVALRNYWRKKGGGEEKRSCKSSSCCWEDQPWMLLSPYEALRDLQEPILDPAFVYTLSARYANPLSLSYWDIKHVWAVKGRMSSSLGLLRQNEGLTPASVATFRTPASQSNFGKAFSH